jgi:anti-sigma factor RsiW
MTCKDVEHNLPKYLEDALSPQEKSLVEEHLAACPQCKKSLAHLEKTGMLLKEMEVVEPPPWFTQKIMSQVRKETKQKESLFRRVFYPLHIKIPIQALATVLIAVIAFQIYRVGEPEMQVAVPPPSAVFEPGKVQAPEVPQKSSEFAPPSAAKGTAIPMEGTKRGTDMFAPSPPVRSEDAIRGQEMRFRDEVTPHKPVIAEEKRETVKDKSNEARQTASSVKQQEFSQTLPAQPQEYKMAERSDYADFAKAKKAKKEYESPPAAAPQVMGAAVSKIENVRIAVHVADAKASMREVETLLNTLGARKIRRQFREKSDVVTAIVEAHSVPELMRKIKAMGELEEREVPADIRVRNVFITVEILSNR